MASQWPRSNQPGTFPRPDIEQVKVLMRELVGMACIGAPSVDIWKPGNNPDEILLDIEFEGVRYLLVRVPPKAVDEQMMLSPRELEIARMVAAGYVNKTIAGVLDISAWTVGTHLRRIFAKLGVRTRAAMVAHLLEEGWLKEQPNVLGHDVAPRPLSVR